MCTLGPIAPRNSILHLHFPVAGILGLGQSVESAGDEVGDLVTRFGDHLQRDVAQEVQVRVGHHDHKEGGDADLARLSIVEKDGQGDGAGLRSGEVRAALSRKLALTHVDAWYTSEIGDTSDVC